MHAKCKVSISYGAKVIAKVKVFLQQTDGQTDKTKTGWPRIPFQRHNNALLSGSKIVKRLRRRKFDSVIIERTIGLVLGPSTALYRSFLKHCTLTKKAAGTI